MQAIKYYISVFSVALVAALLLSGLGLFAYIRYMVAPAEAQEIVGIDTLATDTTVLATELLKKEPAPAPAYMEEPRRTSEQDRLCGDRRVAHPSVGTTASSADGSLRITLIDKRQNYGGPADTREQMIHSPKSANIHPNGQKYYINSLEGASTVVFDFRTNKRLKVIHHEFTAAQAGLWAKPSGLWPVTHYTTRKDFNTFTGKPVESTFSHGGRYLWIPYYRRSFDINAQDPSAMAVIDTETDEIIRMFETGPLPKMVQTSPDGTRIAVAHWGNNTVGVLDISSPKPEDWSYVGRYVVDYELPLNYSLTTPVNRDSGSGYALRGTVFTPDNRYLVVGCMGGEGGLVVIDMEQNRYLGRLTGMMQNTRHLVLHDRYLYLSVNTAGYVQRYTLDSIYAAIGRLSGKTAALHGAENCQVMPGARTLCLSPDGRYAYVACNTASQICVVDTRTMEMIAHIPADSYPVGMDLSACGRYLITTSQGRNDCGGNAVDIYKVERK